MNKSVQCILPLCPLQHILLFTRKIRNDGKMKEKQLNAEDKERSNKPIEKRILEVNLISLNFKSTFSSVSLIKDTDSYAVMISKAEITKTNNNQT